ncbi:hypothetical protein J3E68DRAFT_398776 [Trichoderma sp. SZMC 28012]
MDRRWRNFGGGTAIVTATVLMAMMVSSSRPVYRFCPPTEEQLQRFFNGRKPVGDATSRGLDRGCRCPSRETPGRRLLVDTFELRH